MSVLAARTIPLWQESREEDNSAQVCHTTTYGPNSSRDGAHLPRDTADVRYSTSIVQTGNNTGIEVPAAVLEQLGGGRRPAVTVSINGYRYRSSVGAMGGRAMIPLSAEHRSVSGLAGGDPVEVDLSLDAEPRVLDVPPDLRAALSEDQAAAARFDGLSYSARRRIVTAVDGAKGEDTRRRRIAKAVRDLREVRA